MLFLFLFFLCRSESEAWGQRLCCIFLIKGTRYSLGFRGGCPSRGNCYSGITCIVNLSFIPELCLLVFAAPRLVSVVERWLNSASVAPVFYSVRSLQVIFTMSIQIHSFARVTPKPRKQRNNYLLLLLQRGLHHVVLLASQRLLLTTTIVTVHYHVVTITY